MASADDEPFVLLLGKRTGHDEFAEFARGRSWVLREDRPGSGPKDVHEQVWATPDQGTVIHYMVDPKVKERFLVIYGRGTGDVAFQIGAAKLEVRDRDDIVDEALVADSDSQRVAAAWRLGIVAKAYDEAVLDLLKSLYDGASDDVREAVINATGYRGWPESREFLERVAATDPSADLRRNALEIVEARWGK
jgi:AcrR family transcriptional regulator